CVQQVPAHRQDGKGYVRVEFLEKDDWEETALVRLIETIENLQDKGYMLKDIAILIRDKKSGVEISNYFMQEKEKRPGNYRYDIISSDSLFLRNAPVVQWIISLLRFLTEPADELNRAFLVNEFKDYLHITPSEENDFDKLLEDFLDGAAKYKSMPVYELVDTITGLFGLSSNRSNMPYLQSLQDTILQYGKKNTIDLASFLLWWDDFSDKQVISMPENQDAIRLMTIHASKGLEFKVVLVPFASWDFTSRASDTFIWAVPEEAPFDKFKLLPVQLGSATANSIFSYEYFREQIYTKIDNLNLLYVAFTRAIEKLIVFAPQSELKGESKSTGHLLTIFRNNFALGAGIQYLDTVKLRLEEAETVTLLEYGKNSDATRESLTESSDIRIDEYKTSSIEARKSKMVVAGEFKTVSAIDNNARVKGNLLHEMFRNIRTSDDIEIAATELVKKGMIPADEAPALIDEINGMMKTPGVQQWFDSSWDIKTEADILLKTGELKRPDRIMFGNNKVIIIDYKFGEKEEESHLRQVLNYKSKLQQMGYRNIEAHVWYVILKKVVTPTDKPVQGKLFE
ncbi:MAG TPA: 3'-5' exonuclease, partial [Bacteroidales bacterium]|nr:3'-5' exonuclease [Bacteroidales bacterium]